MLWVSGRVITKPELTSEALLESCRLLLKALLCSYYFTPHLHVQKAIPPPILEPQVDLGDIGRQQRGCVFETRDGAVTEAPHHCHQRVEVLQQPQLLQWEVGRGRDISFSSFFADPRTAARRVCAAAAPTWATWMNLVKTWARCCAVCLLRIMSCTHCETPLHSMTERCRAGLPCTEPCMM